MCGIAGIASNRPIERRDWLSSALDVLQHRGPDGAGQWWDTTGRVGLAHRRLSIIDLSAAANQPMSDAGKDFTIVFNGEIYNFTELRTQLAAKGVVFCTQSDTEVLLAAYREWGPDCLSRLNGMFAFALFDRQRQMLFLARDRAGEKPLFYHYVNGELRFASELKGLLADPVLPRRVDAEALDCYLSMGFVPGARCILQGFNKLPAAHAMQFDLSSGEARIWRYWQLPELEAIAFPSPAHEAELLNELEALLEDAVQRQLVADVPVGVLLSGGVDSSLVTAMAVRASRKIKTFTIRFPGHGRLDETEHARLIARHFGTEHVELEAKATTADLLPRLAKQFDEPLIDSSMIPTFLVSQLVRQHCTVALGGDGADELFGGYSHYNRLLWLENQFGWIPRSIRKVVPRIVSANLPLGFKGRNWLQALGGDFKYGVPLIASYFDVSSRQALLGPQGIATGVAEQIYNQSMPLAPDLLSRATRMDFQTYLVEDILVKVDRASMLSSLEIRAPMLDYRIVEFAFGKVPSRLKATSNQKKILLKRLAKRLLPSEFDYERKQGFSIPLAQWLKRGEFRQICQRVIFDSHCIFDKKAVHKLWQAQDRGLNNSERLFGLVMFELWRTENGITF